MSAREPPDMTLAEGLEGPVAGVDEVGRGPWAGPLVAAAVVLGDGAGTAGLDDSKRLTHARRVLIAAEIRAVAAVGLGVVEAAELDRIGLGPANDLAMRRAVAALPLRAASVLVDGRRMPEGLNLPGRAVIGGDARVSAIAAASIVAKVARDAMMQDRARRHPGYGWERNKGYGTAEHRAALERLGLTAEHRRCFRPVALLAEGIDGESAAGGGAV
ncbi:MAG: ribonuclease HII [Pseudomonadota bacterium]